MQATPEADFFVFLSFSSGGTTFVRDVPSSFASLILEKCFSRDSNQLNLSCETLSLTVRSGVGSNPAGAYQKEGCADGAEATATQALWHAPEFERTFEMRAIKKGCHLGLRKPGT